MRLGWLLGMSLTTGAAWLAAGGISDAAADDADRPRLAAGTLSGAIRLDGVLDEPAWAQAASIEDLVMVEPREGDKPTGRTMVKVIANPKALVFGIRCLDPEPSGIVSFTKERDGDFEFEDHVVLVLDPFQEKRRDKPAKCSEGGIRTLKG